MTTPANPPARSPADRVEIWPVEGLPEIRPGDDLADLIAQAAPMLRDGDVLVVTSKIVSKAEGRLVAGDRRAAIDAETVRVVAVRGDTRIVVTRHGLVLAAAGVDASNVAAGTVALLPVDPDASARRLRAGLAARLGVAVGVVVSDTFGRPWRVGQTDVAIGLAGLPALHDLRGQPDRQGRPLEATVIATADEIAAAADLVKGKLSGTPVAIVRGLTGVTGDRGAAADLIRDPAEDLFALGTAEARRSAVTARRTVRRFRPDPVDPTVIRAAVESALTAPAPHHSTPWRFVLVDERRDAWLDAMAAAWRADLAGDGFDEGAIDRRLRRGDVLRQAPRIVVPCLVSAGAHSYPDERRAGAEHAMFVVSAGAAVQSFLIALAAEGLGSCWVSSTLFCPDVTRVALQLPADFQPMGAVAIGYPEESPPSRPIRDVSDFVVSR